MVTVVIYLVGAIAVSGALAKHIHFLTTPRTPEYISQLITAFFGHSILPSTDQNFRDLEDVTLDYSYSETVTHSQQSERAVVMWHSQATSCARDCSYELKFTQYLQQLGFTEVVLIADTGDHRLDLCQRLLDSFPLVYSEIITISYQTDLSYTLDLVGRIIKPSGNNLFALFTDELSTWNLLQAFEKKRLMKEGFAYILSAQSSYSQQFGTLAEGLLYVAPAVTAFARSAEDADRMQLEAVVRWLEGRDPSIPSLLSYLDESPVLVSIQRDASTLIPADSLRSIRFPGNSTAAPKRQQGIIQVTANYRWAYPNGSISSASSVIMRGVQVAFEEKNNGTNLFPTFRVSDLTLELSRFPFDLNFTRLQIARNLNSLGLLHFPIPSGSVVLSLFKVFREMSVTLPMCMSLGSTTLSSPKDYPLFLRPRTSELYTARVLATVFKYFGWRRAAVLYSKDDGDNEGIYRAFLNYSVEFQINFTNSESARALSDSLYASTSKQLNDSLKEIMQSSARILVVFHYELVGILRALYGLGVRSRYLIVIASGFPISELERGDYKKYSVVAKGAIQIFPRAFIGEVGRRVRRELVAKDGKNYYSNSCFYYDAAMLYLHATDYLIRMGHDYEDPYEIVKAMRSTHFTGCSGTITIAPGLNDKSEAEYSIMNFKYFERNSSFVLEDAMYFNPFSVVLFKAVSAFMWPDNSTVFTDTLLSTFDCPFLEEQVHHYSTGVAIGFAVSYSICGLTIVFSVCIWRKWWRTTYPLITEQTELSADDLLQMIAIPIEFLQQAAVAPECSELSHTVSQLLQAVSAATGSAYWHLVHFAFAGAGAYTFLCVAKLTGLDVKLEWAPLWSFIMLFANLTLPVLSSLLFLPIVSTVSKLFFCCHAVGEGLESSVLDSDCYTYCWHGAHRTYVICGSISLALYIPLGVYGKPMWQEAQDQLHIRAQPVSLMAKSVVQVLLLTLSNTLKPDHRDLHAGLFLAVIVAYLAFKLKVPQYNYHRCVPCRLNLWDAISTCSVLTFSILALVSAHYPHGPLYLLLSGSAGALYIAAGTLAQRKVKAFASRFFRRKINPSPIFHFAFTFGTRANKYLDIHNSLETDFHSRVPRTSIAVST